MAGAPFGFTIPITGASGSHRVHCGYRPAHAIVIASMQTSDGYDGGNPTKVGVGLGLLSALNVSPGVFNPLTAYWWQGYDDGASWNGQPTGSGGNDEWGYNGYGGGLIKFWPFDAWVFHADVTAIHSDGFTVSWAGGVAGMEIYGFTFGVAADWQGWSAAQMAKASADRDNWPQFAVGNPAEPAFPEIYLSEAWDIGAAMTLIGYGSDTTLGIWGGVALGPGKASSIGGGYTDYSSQHEAGINRTWLFPSGATPGGSMAMSQDAIETENTSVGGTLPFRGWSGREDRTDISTAALGWVDATDNTSLIYGWSGDKVKAVDAATVGGSPVTVGLKVLAALTIAPAIALDDAIGGATNDSRGFGFGIQAPGLNAACGVARATADRTTRTAWRLTDRSWVSEIDRDNPGADTTSGVLDFTTPNEVALSTLTADGPGAIDRVPMLVVGDIAPRIHRPQIIRLVHR